MFFFRISRQIPENSDVCRFFNQICENKSEICRKFQNSEFCEKNHYYLKLFTSLLGAELAFFRDLACTVRITGNAVASGDGCGGVAPLDFRPSKDSEPWCGSWAARIFESSTQVACATASATTSSLAFEAISGVTWPPQPSWAAIAAEGVEVRAPCERCAARLSGPGLRTATWIRAYGKYTGLQISGSKFQSSN